jgi:hypothetical protein
VAGDRVRYEHDREGNTVMVTESRKRVSASTSAAVTPSREAQDRVLGYFVREGHVSTAIKEREDIAQRKKEVLIIEKLDAKDRRSAARKLRRSARAATAQGCRAEIESEAKTKASDALTIMSDHLRERGLFDKYGPIPLEGEFSSDEEVGETSGDCVYEVSSDSGFDYPPGEANTKTGRKAQRRRYKRAKKRVPRRRSME